MSERSIAIISSENNPDLPRVRTESFVDYLISGELANASEFAPHLNLSRFKPTFQKLWQESQQVEIHGKRHKKAIKKHSQKYSLVINSDLSKEYVEQEADGERFTCIYYDPSSQLVSETGITHGNYGYVNIGNVMYDLVKNKKVPIIPVHTHPDNSPLSPTDYEGLLVSIKSKNPRIFRANIVLANDFQMLALPTKDTPEIPMAKSNGYIKRANKDAARVIDKRMEKLDKLFDRLLKTAEMHRRQQLKKLKKRKKHLTDEEKLLMITDFEAFKTRIFTEFADDDQKDRKLQDRLSRATDKNIAIGIRIQNHVLIQFAKDHNIQLYFSTDMENFKAFTA